MTTMPTPNKNLPILTSERFLDLFLEDTPFIDVRSEIEFQRGSIPNAHNLPILNTLEREMVGKCYKDQGPTKAVHLGLTIMSGETLLQRQERWSQFLSEHPNAIIYCFRGGLRSSWAQTFICAERMASASPIARIEGGYKALRNFLISSLNTIINQRSWIILGGKTGAGKTLFLNRINNAGITHAHTIDLEGLANHRGSAFGGNSTPQPTQIDFENHLAVKLLKSTAHHQHRPTIIENESRLIGTIAIPELLYQKIQSAPIIILDKSVEERAEHILQGYIIDRYRQLCKNDDDDEQAINALCEELGGSLTKISKKLGGLRFQQILTLLHDGKKCLIQSSAKDFSGFLPFITALLIDYYDPFYLYNQTRNQHRTLMMGSEQEILDFLKRRTTNI
jgi:tRNA 2-selenouridine synthase